VEKLKKKLALYEAQLEESFARSRDTNERLKDTHERLLRTAAEFENFKKRAGRERTTSRSSAARSCSRTSCPSPTTSSARSITPSSTISSR